MYFFLCTASVFSAVHFTMKSLPMLSVIVMENFILHLTDFLRTVTRFRYSFHCFFTCTSTVAGIQ